MSNEAVTRGDLVRDKAGVQPDSGAIWQSANTVPRQISPCPKGGIHEGDLLRQGRSPWRRHAFAPFPRSSSLLDAITASLLMGLDPR